MDKVCSALTACSNNWRTPERISVVDGVMTSLYIDQPGGYVGRWSPDEANYMVDPMNTLASRRHEAVCFVGPSRTGKTMALLDGWIAYAATCDPGDMLVIQMTQEKAREYSKTRVDRAIRHSPEMRKVMSQGGHDDNTHDKTFRHGMFLKIGWPSATQLSGSDYRYVGLTDYDRMPDNIDGEGAPYSLAVKRTQTFLSRGMCMVESSPGRDIADPIWTPTSPHEAPPVSGVLGIYNRSDRRRWYWPCPHCGGWFEASPGLSLFGTLPPEDDLLEMVRRDDLVKLADRHALVVCPSCGSMIDAGHKRGLNASGKWLAEGQRIADGQTVGDAMQSSIAGYWLGGVAASYQSWQSIILRYLQGLREYVMTGAEETLKSSVNMDQGMPYLPRHLSEASAGQSSQRSDIQRYVVPSQARFLIAAVDVQGGTKGRFVVQVHAIGVGLEQWIIDRYDIKMSPRGDDIAIDPAGYLEDWDAITERVVGATYRIGDGRELRVHMTVVDSGGEAGVTGNAYAWYRRIRASGFAKQVMLVKGESTKTDTPVRMANARDTRGKPLRDVILWLVNTDHFKDVVSASRRRQIPGPGFMHLPIWLPDSIMEELSAEVRGNGGKWHKVRARNEALDLWVYVLAACWRLQAHKIKWDSAPGWAKPLDVNTGSITADDRREEREARTSAARIPVAQTTRRGIFRRAR